MRPRRDDQDPRALLPALAAVLTLPGPLKKLAAAAAPIHVAQARRDLLRRAAAGEEYFWNYEIAWPESQKGDILSPAALRATAGVSAGAVVARDAQRCGASAHGNRDYLNHIIYRMMQDYYFGNLMLGKLDLLSAPAGPRIALPLHRAGVRPLRLQHPGEVQAQGQDGEVLLQEGDRRHPARLDHLPAQAGVPHARGRAVRGPLGDWGRAALLDGGLTRTGFLRRDVAGARCSASTGPEATTSTTATGCGRC